MYVWYLYNVHTYANLTLYIYIYIYNINTYTCVIRQINTRESRADAELFLGIWYRWNQKWLRMIYLFVWGSASCYPDDSFRICQYILFEDANLIWGYFDLGLLTWKGKTSYTTINWNNDNVAKWSTRVRNARNYVTYKILILYCFVDA